MDTINLAIILAGTVNAFLGGIIIIRNRQNRSNRWFSLFTISIVAWSFTMIMFRLSKNYTDAFYWLILLYTSAIFIPVTLFYFVYYFPAEEKKLKKIYSILIWLPVITITYLTCKSDLIINGVSIPADGEKNIFWGSMFWLYNIYILSYFSLTYVILFTKFLKSSGILRKQLKFIIFATVFTGILANVSNLLLPSFGIFNFNWFGQIQAIFLVIFIFYAIVKYRLLEIKVIAIELISALIPLALFIDSATAKSQPEFISKISLTLIVSFFSYLVVKSVRKEIKSKEELEKLARQLQKANNELQRLDLAKSDFLSIASHQLRTPLTAIKGYSSMLLDDDYDKLPDGNRKIVEKIFLSARRLAVIVDDFLDVSKIEAGEMKYDIRKFNLKETIKNIVDDFITNSQKARDLNLQFSWENKDFTVHSDQGKITQVVSNTLDNAIKYTPSGHVEVYLSRNEEQNKFLIKVKDTGVGISGETLAGLFQKFTRAKEIYRLHTDGSGLGLYVAKRIMKDLRGRIWAKSEGAGKGSEFFIELPAN